MVNLKIRCPDNCAYRHKLAPMCGFCLKKILEDLEQIKKGGEKIGQKSKNSCDGEID